MKKELPVKARSAKKANGKTKPIKNKEEVQKSNDQRIDEDFPGFPHPPSTEGVIRKKKTIPKH